MASIKTMTGRNGAKSYRVRWYYPAEDGCPAQEQRVTWRNLADARTLRGVIDARGGRVRATDPDVLDHSIVTGTPTREDLAPARPDGPTVPEVITEFLAKKELDGRKENTLETYDCANRAGLLRAAWGTELMADIDEAKARGLLVHIKHIGMDHRAPWQFLTSLVRFAMARGYLSTNPLALIATPPRPEPDPRYITQEEFEHLLSKISPNEPEFWLAVVTAWESGLREGEIAALSREDVTVINGKGYITVRHTVALGKKDANGKRPVIMTPPKSGKNRPVVISEELAARLLAPGRHPVQIFPGRQDPKALLRPEYLRKRFEAARALAKLPGRPPVFHDLRHSHASNQLGAGVDMYVVSKRLGHASIQMTVDIYGHLGKKAEDAQLAAIAAHAVPGVAPLQNAAA